MARNACSAATCRFFSFLLLLLPCLLSSQLDRTQDRIVKSIFHTIRLNMSPYKFLNTTAADPCFWRKVTCGPSPTSDWVIDLSFSDLGITFNNSTALSSFFSLICSLHTLDSLDLSSNHLTSIPGAFFSSCTGLSTLDLSQNSLSGEMPSQLSNYNLSYLYMNDNNLSGSIPSTLTNMYFLWDLQLGDNKLSGTIPLMPPSIRSLNLSHNYFGGPIPSTSFNISSRLGILDLSHNNFSCSVPNSLTRWQFLTFLDLSDNNLSGEIPPHFTNLTNLINLHLNGNNLSGSISIIPPSITTLNLSYNSFGGPILSSSFDDSFNLEILDLSHNNFSGSVPNSLTCLKFLFFLDLSYNNLSGELPIFGKRVNLVITGNNVSPSPTIIDSNSKSGSEISTVGSTELSTVSLVVLVGSFVNGLVASFSLVFVITTCLKKPEGTDSDGSHPQLTMRPSVETPSLDRYLELYKRWQHVARVEGSTIPPWKVTEL